MQQVSEPTPSATAASFAGLLAALTSQKSSSAWNDHELADDVVSLSYENALRAHARYRAEDRDDGSLIQPPAADKSPVDGYELAPAETVAAARAAAEPVAPAPPPARNRKKCASVTIRMSQEESAELHRRAAEASLTVSAYLRSCTFEAEKLRAMVKETMAQLKAASAANEQTPQHHASSCRLPWLLAPWRASRRVARA